MTPDLRAQEEPDPGQESLWAPDGWCHECGDEFHLDDCGGYNPPCPCGCGLCRSCHESEEMRKAEYDEGYPDDEETA